MQPLGNPVVAVLNCVNGRSNFMQTFWRLLRKNHLDIEQSIYAIITDHSNLVIVRSTKSDIHFRYRCLYIAVFELIIWKFCEHLMIMSV